MNSSRRGGRRRNDIFFCCSKEQRVSDHASKLEFTCGLSLAHFMPAISLSPSTLVFLPIKLHSLHIFLAFPSMPLQRGSSSAYSYATCCMNTRIVSRSLVHCSECNMRCVLSTPQMHPNPLCYKFIRIHFLIVTLPPHSHPSIPSNIQSATLYAFLVFSFSYPALKRMIRTIQNKSSLLSFCVLKTGICRTSHTNNFNKDKHIKLFCCC